MHVKGELDSKDLIEKVSRRRRCPPIDGQADGKMELGRGDREWERGRRSKRGKMMFYRRCNKCESLGEGLRTAVLRAVAGGRLARHVAVGTHAVHGHRAAGSTRWMRALHAGQHDQCRLNRE